jgi:DNA polymerase III alpha subunit
MILSKEIIHLALRSGYSFKHVYGHLEKIISYGENTGAIGISDIGNTFCHPLLEKSCKEKNIKPIYSVRLTVVNDAAEKVKPSGQFGCEYIFIAKNNSGLKEIYRLVKIYYDNFYYRGNISLKDVFNLSKNVIVIAENFNNERRIDYIALTTTTPKMIKTWPKIPKVAIVNNYYPEVLDYDVYDLFTAPRNNSNQTYQQHILSTIEWKRLYKNNPEMDRAINNTHVISESCEDLYLERAPMIKYKGVETIEFLCKIGAKNLKINLLDGVYKERYDMELKLIKEKGYGDYFLVVADVIKKAKKRMLVGPCRGSSGGSLVCYLLRITECLDPIKYGLLFDRFIDRNRSDLPDIDIDFPDSKRDSVIKQIIKDYGEDQVRQIAIISKMKPKIAIGEFAKSLNIPAYETEELKNSIIERSGGDARAAMKMKDTFETIEVGKNFIEKYPGMKVASEIENHPRHSGVHAAGVIICNEPIVNFAGINTRDNTVMVDKKTAEDLNLLKIDILGLRTLSILQDCAEMVGMDYKDFYSLDTEKTDVLHIFNEMRLSGIFQFEGYSLTSLTRKMGINKFEDIVAITSLARPGALYSGGARRYITYRLGEESPIFVGEEHKEITKSTYGIVVYQEQILRMCREIGGMSWEDVNALRRALSKSLGKEYFNRYKEKFCDGAKKKKYSEEDSEFLWSEIENGGAYAFNRSHAVGYALISYWCAYMKYKYPKEFVVANLNNTKDPDSAIKILRDATVYEDIEYVPIDSDESLKKWSVNSAGVIVGALTNIKGIGPANANKIISSRETGEALPPSIILKMLNPVTDYDILFPCNHYWGRLFTHFDEHGLSSPPSKIVEVQEKGSFLIVGKLIQKNVRDLNEYVNLQKRGGKVLERDSLMISIKVEDDTDSIMCNIGRFDYEEKGRIISEHGEIDEDWYLIKGKIKAEGRYLTVIEIMKLEEEMMK